MSGFGGGTSTGNGAGFTQSSNAFGGLTNTDLRPGRRRRRPVPLLDTSWPINRRNKERPMLRKDVTDLVGTLRTSVLSITASGTDDPEAVLTKSFGEFDTTLQELLDERYGPDPQTLAKGLNHISAFAQQLAQMNRTVNALKTGRPSWMVGEDSSMPAETLPEEISDALDRFMRVGIFTLRTMVNDSAELPADDADLERAEKAGRLAKVDTERVEILVKTDLPEEMRDFTDPLELLVEAAELGRSLTTDAISLADTLMKGDPDIFSAEFAAAYPEVFEADDLNKAGAPFPPKKKPAEADAGTAARNGGGGAGQGGTDENVGAGGDPNDDATEQDPNDAGAGGGTDITDDTPQNPLEMIARMASIIVVISGSLLQGQGAGEQDDANAGVGATADDSRNVGLQREEPIADVPLEKILKGEIVVSESLGNALEELLTLRKLKPTLEKTLAEQGTELDTMKKTLLRLETTAAAPIGVQRTVTIDKTSDVVGDLSKGVESLANEVDRLRKNNDPSAAAKLLIVAAHSGGGRPLVPLM